MQAFSHRRRFKWSRAKPTEKSHPLRQTWTQLFLIGKSATFDHWPLSTQQSTEISHSEWQWDPDAVSQTNSWQMQTSSRLCINACNCVRTRRRNLASFVRALASAESTTSSEYMVTPFFMKKKPPRPLTKLGKGHSKDSSQILPRTVQSKPRSAGQSGIGYKIRGRCSASTLSELSLQPNNGFWT